MDGHFDGTNVNESDGGQELKTRLNTPFFQYFIPGSFIDQEEAIPNYIYYEDVNGEHPQSDSVDYFIYYQETTGLYPCLENEKLTFYLAKAHDIIYTYDDDYLPGTTLLGQRPVGKSFMGFRIWTPNGTLANGNSWWKHVYYIDYGTRVNIPLPTN
ncbi:MAG: hypothetical protein HQ521_07890 [Bacteroidetes bacterium]|nr:hypothetical protein [Bacteroidota bacterium]